MWPKLLLGAIGLACGVYLLCKAIIKRKKIDTESVAEVTKNIELGRADLKKVYAITYTVNCSEPFEIIETPKKKPANIGKERVIFFEKANPKKNHYFKLIGSFDRRLILPALIILGSVFIIVAVFL